MAKQKAKGPGGVRKATLTSPLLGKGGVHQKSRKAQRKLAKAGLRRGADPTPERPESD